MLLLWAAILVPPLIALAQQLLGFMLVPWACATGLQPYICLVSLVCLCLALGGAAIGWRAWQRSGSEWPGEGEGAVPVTRFLAAGAIGIGLMSALLILAQGIPTFILHPCQ